MLGLFITGPLGVGIGIVFGYVASDARFSNLLFFGILGLVAVVGAIAILWASSPRARDDLQGSVIDAEIVKCEAPVALMAKASGEWERACRRKYPASAIRMNWRRENAQLLEREPLSVVTVRIHHRWEIVKSGDQLKARSRFGGLPQTFLISGDCSAHPLGSRGTFFAQTDATSYPTNTCPPVALPRFSTCRRSSTSHRHTGHSFASSGV